MPVEFWIRSLAYYSIDDLNVGEAKESTGAIVVDGIMLEEVKETFKEGRVIAGNLVFKVGAFYERSIYLYLITDFSGSV